MRQRRRARLSGSRYFACATDDAHFNPERHDAIRGWVYVKSETLEGAQVWVLPNPSGLNANYQLPQIVELFKSLRKAT